MDWTEIIIAAISGGAISGGILRFLTIKPTTKKAMAEAKAVEIDNLNKVIETISKQSDQTITQLDKRIDKIQSDLDALNRKYEQKVIVIRQAYKCQVPNADCPVLKKQLDFSDKEEEIKGCETCKENNNENK